MAAASAAPGPAGDLPDMALVVTGATGRTRTLHSGEPDFARLWQLLRPTDTDTERVPEDWTDGRYPEVRVTVIWGLTGVGGRPQTHRAPRTDVAMERQDQLFVAADGTPWVRSDPAPDVADDDIRWHRAPRTVFRQLDRTDLLGPAAERKSGSGADTATRAGVTGGAWWALPGLGVGVGIGFLIRRAAARQGAGPPREEPRQELIDLDV
ncbi:hypothetical protein [Streptomyces sp. NPDC046805]|uniref:hypothetical protein n=1 Tax=Streptomyces sp. NPDC046805 TaxID=3155134 RepID=UPI0033E1083D